MENQTEESALTLKEIFYIIKRHIFLEAAIVFIGIIIGVIIALTNKDVFIATTKVSHFGQSYIRRRGRKNHG